LKIKFTMRDMQALGHKEMNIALYKLIHTKIKQKKRRD